MRNRSPSMANAINELSGKRRRLSSGVGLLRENDDEAERVLRRRSTDSNLSVKSSKSGAFLLNELDKENKQDGLSLSGKVISGRKSQGRTISREKLLEIQNFTLEMLAKNKINIKNSWDLDIIDHMTELINVEGDVNESKHEICNNGEQTQPDLVESLNFQKASCTLDASVKIYSYRVDSVHTQTYKVLGGLSRNNAVEEDANPNEEDEPNEADKSRKKKATQARRSTLATASMLNSKDIDEDHVNSRLDPSLFLVGDGLWLDRLEVHDGCRVMLTFDSFKAERTKFEPENFPLFDITGLKPTVLMDAENSTQLQLLPELDLLHQFLLEAEEDSLFPEKKNNQVADFSLASAPKFTQDASDNEDFDHHESIMHSDVEFNGEDDRLFDFNGFQEQHEHIFPENSPNIAEQPQTSGKLQFRTEPNDYSFFDPNNLKVWKTTSHWKFCKPKRVQVVVKETKTPKPSRKKNSVKNLIDFWGPEISKNDYLPPKSLLKNKLPKSKRLKQEENAADLLLPDSPEQTPEKLMYLFLKPNLRICFSNSVMGKFVFPWNMKPSGAKETVDTDGFPFDNEEGDEPFGFEPDFDENTQFSEDEIQEVQYTSSQSNELELIAKPKKAQKIEINFAKTSKKVDVRALKTNLWKAVCLEADEESEVKESSVTFTNVVCRVTDAMPSHISNEVSVPFYFICLLHLANEHNLNLVPQADPFSNCENSLGDFAIINTDR